MDYPMDGFEKDEQVEKQFSCKAKDPGLKKEIDGFAKLTGNAFSFITKSQIITESEDVIYKFLLSDCKGFRQHQRRPLVQLRYILQSETQGVANDRELTLVFGGGADVATEFTKSLRHAIDANAALAAAKAAETLQIEQDTSKRQHSSRTPVIRKPVFDVRAVEKPISEAIESSLSFINGTDDMYTDHLDESDMIRYADELKATSLNDREWLFEADPDLFNSYKYLVLEEKLLTCDEFWNEHALELASTKSLPVGHSHSHGFLAKPVKLSVISSGQLEVTERELEQILMENPVAKLKFDQLVPQRMMPSEFWMRFFQSKYYSEMVGLAPPDTPDETIFKHFNIEDVGMASDEVTVQQFVEPSVDLLSMEAFRKPGFGTYLGHGSLSGEMATTKSTNARHISWKTVDNQAPGDEATCGSDAGVIMERFNRHSMTLLRQLRRTSTIWQGEQLQKRSNTSGTIGKSSVGQYELYFDKRRDLLKRDTSYADLESEPIVAAVTKKPIFMSYEKPGQMTSWQTQRMAGNRQNCNLTDLQQFLLSLDNWDPLDEGKSGLVSGATTARAMFIVNTKMVQAAAKTHSKEKFRDILESSAFQELVQSVTLTQCRVRELLYQFWNCSVSDKYKRSKLIIAIDTNAKAIQNECKSQSAVNKTLGGKRSLYQPILEAIRMANERNNDVERR